MKDTSTWTVIPSSQVRVSIQNLILVGHVVEAAKLGREELWRDRGTIEAYLPRPHALLKETKSRIAEASPKPSREFYPGEKNGRFETGVGGRVIQEVCPAKKGYHIFGADQNRRRLTQVKKRNDRHRFIQSANCLLLYLVQVDFVAGTSTACEVSHEIGTKWSSDITQFLRYDMKFKAEILDLI